MIVLFLRITIPTTKEELLATLLKKYQKVIVSEELSTNEVLHFHCLITTTETDVVNARQNLKNFLKKEDPNIYGNKSYSSKRVEEGTEKRVAAYTLKDGKYVFAGYSNEEIDKLVRLSYKKFRKEDIKFQIEKIETEYFTGNIGEGMFIDKYMDIRDSYKHKVNYNQVKNYISNVFRLNNPKMNRKFRQQLFEECSFNL